MKFHRPTSIGGACSALCLAALLVTSASAGEQTFRYYRYDATMVRTRASTIQISEFQFIHQGTPLNMTGVTVENPGGTNAVDAGEGALKLIDGSTASKWLSGQFSPVIFDFGMQVTIDSYNFATANDDNGRDPIQWTLSGSNDNIDWVPIDRRDFYPTTTNRQAYEAGFTLPDKPVIAKFAADQVIVPNGTSDVDLSWEVGGADSITISQGIGTVAANGNQTLAPPNNSDTTYTITATNAAGTSTRDVTVRTIAGGTVDYRYIRFHPLKLRSNDLANSIQLADLVFIDDEGFYFFAAAAEGLTGANTPAAEGPANLVDGVITTKWLDFSKFSGVQIDLGPDAPPMQGYSFTLANDAPTRDPVRWYMEGSNDPAGPWTIIETVASFDFNTPTARASFQDFQFPGASLVPLNPPATLQGDSIAVAGSGLAISWNVAQADTISISGVGNVAATGSTIVYPTENTTYTLTATNSFGGSTTVTLPVQVIPALPGGIDYPNFDAAENEIFLRGNAAILTDANLALPAGGERLRLTPNAGSQNGTAWHRQRVAVADGFETEFDLHIVTSGAGADGISFMIQNRPLGSIATLTTNPEAGLSDNSLNISFDGYLNEGEQSHAVVRISNGATILQAVNLLDVPGLTLGGTAADRRLGKIMNAENPAVPTPYHVRVAYLPGNLNVYIDDVAVVTGLNVTLQDANAVAADGKSWVGFAARTGGLSESHDVTSWTLSEGPPVIPSGPLTLLSSSIDYAAETVSLTWASDAEMSYRITSSTDLSDWSQVLQQNIPGQAGQTSATVSFTAGVRTFFRVEEE